jgi:DNA helicase-2/ATP-dependent DNA helicase PcrA
LLRTNELLTRFPDVLAKFQDRFRYILVDEYQDTNHSQYLIVRALADRFQNICVVGDDSQSIYAFRGANIQNILNFQRDYEEVKLFKLEQNYRSTGNIVDAANSVIEKNKTKLEKEIWTANKKGEKVKIMRTLSDGEEGRFVANSIFENKLNLQLSNTDFAVLYRTNAQSRAIEDALRKKDIKYRVYGGLSFYQRKEIKDVLSYLRLLVNPNDEEALKRVINYPARGIGQRTIEKLTIAANHYKRSIFEVLENLNKIDLKLNSGTLLKLNDFVTMIKSFQIESKAKNALEVTSYVLKQTKVIRDLEKDATPEAINRIDNIQELLNGIKDFIEEQKIKNEDASLAIFLEDVALATDLDNEKLNDKNSVSLMTIHLAKGLEFPYVYIVGLEENLFPSAMSMNTRSELEEERRLFYVALTRAEQQAYLSFAQSRYRWGKLIDCDPSRFLDELDDRFIELLSPKISPVINKYINEDIFGNVPQDRLKFIKNNKKSAIRPDLKSNQNQPILSNKFKKVKSLKNNLFDSKIIVGNIIEHSKFGKGEVLKLEGSGSNRKAEIKFDSAGLKKLLLQFAQLKILS